MIFKIVDFPEPFVPIMPTVFPDQPEKIHHSMRNALFQVVFLKILMHLSSDPGFCHIIYYWILTIVLFIIGTKIFKKLKPHFADVL